MVFRKWGGTSAGEAKTPTAWKYGSPGLPLVAAKAGGTATSSTFRQRASQAGVNASAGSMRSLGCQTARSHEPSGRIVVSTWTNGTDPQPPRTDGARHATASRDERIMGRLPESGMVIERRSLFDDAPGRRRPSK